MTTLVRLWEFPRAFPPLRLLLPPSLIPPLCVMKNISIFDYYSDDENFISSRGIPTERRKFPQEKLDFSYQHAKKERRKKKPKKQINNIEKRTQKKKEIIIIHAM
jgi:hypothetical protein